MSKTVMKLALEALETGGWNKTTAAITALREALAEYCVCGEPNTPGTHRTDGPCLAEQPAQPQQEPVAWICEGSSSDEKHAIDYWPGDIEDIPIGTKLYTSPPAQRKPLAYVDLRRVANQCGLGANEVSAQAQAKVDNFARAIEAAHGIKENT